MFVALEDAESELAQLVERACRGEEIIIVRDGVPVAKIIPITAEDLKRD